MDFVTRLLISTNWKVDTYDLILVIVDWLTKMIYYEPVKVTIDAPGLAEIILDVVVRHHGLPDSIVSDRDSVFTSKFWSSLCYFFGIKQRLSTTFHSQTDGQIKRQNSTMEAYLWAFVNFEQDDWARLLPMVKFAYNNVKNASTGHTPFELNCGYHLWASYKEDVDPCSVKISRQTSDQAQRADNRLQREPLACTRASKAIQQRACKAYKLCPRRESLAK